MNQLLTQTPLSASSRRAREQNGEPWIASIGGGASSGIQEFNFPQATASQMWIELSEPADFDVSKIYTIAENRPDGTQVIGSVTLTVKAGDTVSTEGEISGPPISGAQVQGGVVTLQAKGEKEGSGKHSSVVAKDAVVVSFYDGKDKGTEKLDREKFVPLKTTFIAKGPDFKRAAEKTAGKFAYAVDDLNEIIPKLEELKKAGVKIKQINIYDHGRAGQQQVGADWHRIDLATWGVIAKFTEKGGELRFFGCEVFRKAEIKNEGDEEGEKVDGEAMGQQIANQSNRKVSGPKEVVNYKIYFSSGTSGGDFVTKEPQK